MHTTEVEERTFTPYQVTYMMELIFIIEQSYEITWDSVDERYKATEKMYDKAQRIFESEEGYDFCYENELYQDDAMDPIVRDVLENMGIKYRKLDQLNKSKSKSV